MIRYALTAGEITFLGNRLGLPAPGAFACGPQDAQAAYASLREKQLVSGGMDNLSVDMVAALLIKALALPDQTWELKSSKAKALLCRKGRLSLVAAPDPYQQDGYLLEPSQDHAGVQEALSAALGLSGPGRHQIAVRRLEPCKSDPGEMLGGREELDEFIRRLHQSEGDQDGSAFT